MNIRQIPKYQANKMNDPTGSQLRVHKLPRKVVTYNNAWDLSANFLSLRCVRSNDASNDALFLTETYYLTMMISLT